MAYKFKYNERPRSYSEEKHGDEDIPSAKAVRDTAVEERDGKIIKSISFKFPMVFDGKPLVKNSKPEDTISFKLDCADIDIDLPDKGNIINEETS